MIKIKERKKACKQIYMVKQKSEHTKCTLLFNCSNTTQDKTKAGKAPIDKGKSRINNW